MLFTNAHSPEVLERARTAESSLLIHTKTHKSLEASTKKSLSAMSVQLIEAQTSQARAEREAGSLRESVRSLRDVWGREVRGVREEWRRGEERGRREREDAVGRPCTVHLVGRAELMGWR